MTGEPIRTRSGWYTEGAYTLGYYDERAWIEHAATGDMTFRVWIEQVRNDGGRILGYTTNKSRTKIVSDAGTPKRELIVVNRNHHVNISEARKDLTRLARDRRRR